MSCDTIPPVAGKSYRTREGLRFDCHRTDIPGNLYPVFGMLQSPASPEYYTADGMYYASGTPHEFDLVAEWDEPATPDPTPMFQCHQVTYWSV